MPCIPVLPCLCLCRIIPDIEGRGQCLPLGLVQPPDALNDRAMPFMSAMAHVKAGYIHAVDSHQLQHLLRACGRPDGGHNFSAPGAPEAWTYTPDFYLSGEDGLQHW